MNLSVAGNPAFHPLMLTRERVFLLDLSNLQPMPAAINAMRTRFISGGQLYQAHSKEKLP